MSQISPRPGRGRPRLLPGKIAANPRDQILAAAAELFVSRGYAGTTTREIADGAGLRQASIYYHFGSKEEILAALLERSVQARVEQAGKIEAGMDSVAPDAALYALAVSDMSALVAMPYNIGMLYRLPDVIASPVYDRYGHLRGELVAGYGRVAERAAAERVPAGGEPGLGDLLVQMVEGVISLRREDRIGSTTVATIASACLRLCGIAEDAIEQARETALTALAQT
ncbi:AcrR family transcriptional regulator [Nocardioides luteus]|uniref:TetR family transcriptional regulator n=1 Tax=Nocardioides luteus TaxID=1844 RepID=A0ABQ5SYY7_9ACTN|nr:TetR/AcrR family transcriptional regulator [Nocardioides luteus]MDR7310960.1 AcrR family transcriptional regulator [Nocardioides luteus]GGR39491.1 TetR family transcriptional regulator [Nocardioides luteus]GLJ69260.1 TetR family transcriptional regulator [Nocardioides luteus]